MKPKPPKEIWLEIFTDGRIGHEWLSGPYSYKTVRYVLAPKRNRRAKAKGVKK